MACIRVSEMTPHASFDPATYRPSMSVSSQVYHAVAMSVMSTAAMAACLDMVLGYTELALQSAACQLGKFFYFMICVNVTP